MVIKSGITRMSLAVCIASLAAGTHAATSAVEELQEYTVTSTRVEKDSLKVPAAISTVSQDDIQLGRQQLGMDESLVNIPGVFMLNRYNFSQDLRIAIRGFGARAAFGIRGIKVYADGIPQTLADGQSGVDTIDLGSASRMEVIRGPASSLYGAASGGVINIYTEDGPADPFVEGRFTYGEYDYQKYQVKAGGQQDRLNYMVNLSQTKMDGFRGHSHVENQLVNSKFIYKIDDASDFTTIFNAVNSPNADDAGALTAAEVAADRSQGRARNIQFDAGEELDQQKLGFVYSRQLNKNHSIKLRNYYVFFDFANKLPFTDGGIVNIDRVFMGGGAEYIYSDTFMGHNNRLIMGFDIDDQDDDRSRFNNNNGTIGALSFDQNESVMSRGVFIQNELSLTDKLQLTIGARYDVVEFDVSDKFLGDGDDSGKIDFDELSPMVGLSWSVSQALNFYGNVSTAFETPTTTEFANPANNGTAGGFNPALGPQTATNYEIGVKGLLPGQVRYDVALFKIDVKDELSSFELVAAPGRDFFRNAGESSREGLEAALSFKPFRGLTTSLAYTFSDFTYDTFRPGTSVFDGNQLPGIPRHQFHAEVSYYHPSGFYTSWDMLHVGSFFADDANTTRINAYHVANLRMGHSATYGNWEVSPYLGVNNLFGEDYNSNVRLNATFGRFFEPAPDRNIYAGVSARYMFGR